METSDEASTGSVSLAAVYLVTSLIALFATLAFQAWDGALSAPAEVETEGGDTVMLDGQGTGTMVAFFTMWLSAALFTLGIIEFRRSQMPADMAGPDV